MTIFHTENMKPSHLHTETFILKHFHTFFTLCTLCTLRTHCTRGTQLTAYYILGNGFVEAMRAAGMTIATTEEVNAKLQGEWKSQ